MMLDKIVTSLVQMGVVLALYVPILIAARYWQRRSVRRRIAFEATLFKQNKCLCGKWALPAGVGATTPVMVDTVLAAPTTITYGCPECGFPHVVPLKAMTVRSASE